MHSVCCSCTDQDFLLYLEAFTSFLHLPFYLRIFFIIGMKESYQGVIYAMYCQRGVREKGKFMTYNKCFAQNSLHCWSD